MNVSFVQYNQQWESKEENINKINNLIERDFKGSDLLIFPEMTLTGFTMESKKFSENLNEFTFNYFSEIASKHKTDVIAGMIENKNGKFYNTLLHIDQNKKLINTYRKIHPFSHATEDKHYSRGEETIITKINNWKTGLAICYDLRFPELYRNYGKEKVDLIITIANWPDTRIEHWRSLLKARAIENQCYSIGVNRVGDDPEHHYNGFSSIFDPMGKELISLKDQEKIFSIEIDKNEVDKVRNELRFLDDIHLI